MQMVFRWFFQVFEHFLCKNRDFYELWRKKSGFSPLFAFLFDGKRRFWPTIARLIFNLKMRLCARKASFWRKNWNFHWNRENQIWSHFPPIFNPTCNTLIFKLKFCKIADIAIFTRKNLIFLGFTSENSKCWHFSLIKATFFIEIL